MAMNYTPQQYSDLRGTLNKNYAERVERRMRDRQMTMGDLANALNAALGTRWRAQTIARRHLESVPAMPELYAVAQILDCTIDQLVAPADDAPSDYNGIATSAARAAGELERVRDDLAKRIDALREVERGATWKGERERQ